MVKGCHRTSYWAVAGEPRLLEMWGLLYAQKGEVEGARERLAAALDIFRRRGAHNDARRVERALADLP